MAAHGTLGSDEHNNGHRDWLGVINGQAREASQGIKVVYKQRGTGWKSFVPTARK